MPDIDLPELAHLLLASVLLVGKLAFPRRIPAIALGPY